MTRASKVYIPQVKLIKKKDSCNGEFRNWHIKRKTISWSQRHRRGIFLFKDHVILTANDVYLTRVIRIVRRVWFKNEENHPRDLEYTTVHFLQNPRHVVYPEPKTLPSAIPRRSERIESLTTLQGPRIGIFGQISPNKWDDVHPYETLSEPTSNTRSS